MQLWASWDGDDNDSGDECQSKINIPQRVQQDGAFFSGDDNIRYIREDSFNSRNEERKGNQRRQMNNADPVMWNVDILYCK